MTMKNLSTKILESFICERKGERMSVIVRKEQSEKAKSKLEKEFDVRCMKDINNDKVTEFILKQKRNDSNVKKVSDLLSEFEWADYPEKIREPQI